MDNKDAREYQAPKVESVKRTLGMLEPGRRSGPVLHAGALSN